MVLQKQVFDVDFGMGIATKADSKMIPLGKLSALENGVFTADKQIAKRNAFTTVDTGTTPTTSQFDSIFEYKQAAYGLVYSDPLNIKHIDRSGASSKIANATNPFIPTADAGWFPSYSYTPAPFQNTQTSQGVTYVDGVVYNSFAVFVTQMGSGDIYYTVVDSLTKEVLVAPTFVASGSYARLLVVGTSILLGYVDGTSTLRLGVISPASSFSYSSAAASAALNAAHPYWDWALYGSYAMLYANDSGATNIVVKKLDSSAVVAASASFAGQATHSICSVSTDGADQNTSYCLWHDGSGMHLTAYNVSTLAVVTAPAIINGSTSDYDVIVAMYHSLQDGGRILIAAEAAPVGGISGGITWYSYRIASAAVSTSAITKGLGIASKFAYGVSKADSVSGGSATSAQDYILLACNLSSQKTYFLHSLNGTVPALTTEYQQYAQVCAKTFYGIAGGYLSQRAAPNVTVSSTLVFIPGLRSAQIVSTNGTLNTLNCPAMIRYDFQNSKQSIVAELGNGIHLAGGMLMHFDGTNFVEHGFTLYPSIKVVSNGGGGSLSAGSYSYVAVFEKYDAKGNLHQSAPSLPVTVTTVANDKVIVSFPVIGGSILPTLTNQYTISIAIYRTLVGGSIYYRVSTIGSQPVLSSANYADSASDASVSSNDILYTASGALSNWNFDGPTVVGRSPNRLSINAPDDDSAFRFSQQVVSGYGVTFAAELEKRLPDGEGPQLAHVWMDDKCVVFRARQTYFMNGDGPNALGQQDTFSEFQTLSTDLGIESGVAWALTPKGILFKSAKGIYMLGRDMSLGPENYVGRDVEAYNQYLVTRAVHVPDTNQVLFLLASQSKVLAYDYYRDQWSVWTGILASDLCIVSGTLYAARNSFATGGYLLAQTAGQFADQFNSAAPVTATLKITTGYLKPAGTSQGWACVWAARLLGAYRSGHTLEVDVDFDYEGTWAEVHTVLGTDAKAGSTAYQPEIIPKRQRCEAISLRIKDTSQSGTGESFNLASLQLEAGMRTGGIKLRSEKRA